MSRKGRRLAIAGLVGGVAIISVAVIVLLIRSPAKPRLRYDAANANAIAHAALIDNTDIPGGDWLVTENDAFGEEEQVSGNTPACNEITTYNKGELAEIDVARVGRAQRGLELDSSTAIFNLQLDVGIGIYNDASNLTRRLDNVKSYVDRQVYSNCLSDMLNAEFRAEYGAISVSRVATVTEVPNNGFAFAYEIGFGSLGITLHEEDYLWIDGNATVSVRAFGVQEDVTSEIVNAAIRRTQERLSSAASLEAANTPARQSSMAVALASGSIHTCALISDRTVKCWGDNPYGQLGDGSTGDRDTPVEVSGLIGNVTAIATGLRHTCAVTDAGGVECWGRNNWGQLGDESLNDRLSPVAVRHLPHKAAAIAAGSFHTCALSTEGGVMCWGDNDMNQLGGATADSYSDVPLDVPSLTQNVVAITAGAFQTCALTSDGGVKCWGETNSTPVDVPGLTRGVIAVSSGFFHSCAITASGGVLCWGDNSSSQLGDGSNTDSSTPVQVSGLPSGISAISAGALHTCALSSSGGVMCWGDNSSGQLGNGTMTDSAMPVAVTGLSNGVTAVASGSLHSCALEKTGDVKCWGKNISGQLGNSSRADSMLPVDVEGLGDE